MGFCREFRGFVKRNRTSFLFYFVNTVVGIFGPLSLAIICAGISGFLLYPQWRAKFDLFFTETEENRRRVAQCPSIKSVFLDNFQ